MPLLSLHQRGAPDPPRCGRLRLWRHGDAFRSLSSNRRPSPLIIGPSGAGKSTLLNLIAGFETAKAGRILIDGADVTNAAPALRPVSMVFQDNNLFAHLDVAANVGLGRKSRPQTGAKLTRRPYAEAIRTRLVSPARNMRKPEALSGGERQRVAIAQGARTEPAGALAGRGVSPRSVPLCGMRCSTLSVNLQKETGMTVVMVTHHPGDALRLHSYADFSRQWENRCFGTCQQTCSPTKATNAVAEISRCRRLLRFPTYFRRCCHIQEHNEILAHRLFVGLARTRSIRTLLPRVTTTRT